MRDKTVPGLLLGALLGCALSLGFASVASNRVDEIGYKPGSGWRVTLVYPLWGGKSATVEMLIADEDLVDGLDDLMAKMKASVEDLEACADLRRCILGVNRELELLLGTRPSMFLLGP